MRSSLLTLALSSCLIVGCTTQPAVSPAAPKETQIPLETVPTPIEEAPLAPNWTVSDLTPFFESGPLAEALKAYHEGKNDLAATIFDAYTLGRQGDEDRLRSARFLALLAHHDAGRSKGAGTGLDTLASQWPLLADYASFFAGAAHFEAKRYEEALASLARVPADSSLRGRAVALHARAFIRLKRPEEARSMLEEDLVRRDDQLSHWRLLADVHGALDSAGARHAALREVASRFPHRAEGRAARDALGSKPGFSREQLLRIARVYHDRHEHKRAVKALHVSLKATPARGPVWCQTKLLLGRTLEKMKKRAEAWPHFEDALQCEGDALASATFLGGRNRLRAEKYEAAESLLAHHLEAFSDRTTADDAALMRADAARRAGHEKLADERLLEQLERWPQGDMADAATWALLWPRISRESWPEAIEIADRALELVPRERSYRAEGRTSYWRAVALHETGKQEDAIAGWTQVLRAYPLSWYALMAHERLGRLGLAKKTLKTVITQTQTPPDPLASIPRSMAQSVRFRKGVALARMGLMKNARREFSRLEPTGNPEERRSWTWTLIALYDQVGAHDSATALARAEEPWFGQTWPVGSMKRLWKLAHPKAYAEPIERWAAERQINPYWIWAIMREESSFNPTIESWANATGLMQIIIPTAKGLVRGTKIPPTKDSLRQPEIAIELGSKLLAQLIKEHPVIPLASTGYNAGSGATRSWRKRFGHLELDRLVEHITYKEARGYAKRVSRSVARYSWLYGRDQGAQERASEGPYVLWAPKLDPPDPTDPR
jgi:soluble lytic murein transglycosylase